MSGELNIKYSATGKTILALILGSDRTTRWNGAAMVNIASVSAANWTTGMVTLAEQQTSDSAATATYVGNFPAGITNPGEYVVQYYLSTAATPGSQAVGVQDVWWDGTSIKSPANYIAPDNSSAESAAYNASMANQKLGTLYETTIEALLGGLATGSSISNVLSAVQNIQNNTFIAANIPPILQVPASGQPQTITITLAISDETGAAHDIDSNANPAVVLINNAGTDRSSRLSSWQHPTTGKYTAAYSNSAGDAIEDLYWEITATVNGKLRRYVAATQLVNTIAVDFTSSDRQTLSGIAAQLGTAGSGLIALGDTRLSNLDAAVSQVKTKTDKIPDEPAAVGSAMTLESAQRDAIAAALLDLGNAVDGKTLRQALRIIAAVLAGKVSGAGSGTETFRGLDDHNDRVVVVADACGNRTDVTYT